MKKPVPPHGSTGTVDGFGFGSCSHIDHHRLSLAATDIPVAAPFWVAVPRVHRTGHENAAGDETGATLDDVFQMVVAAAIKGMTEQADIGCDVGYAVYGFGGGALGRRGLHEVVNLDVTNPGYHRIQVELYRIGQLVGRPTFRGNLVIDDAFTAVWKLMPQVNVGQHGYTTLCRPNMLFLYRQWLNRTSYVLHV